MLLNACVTVIICNSEDQKCTRDEENLKSSLHFRYFFFLPSPHPPKPLFYPFDLQYIKVMLWVWKTIRWPFAGQQVSFKSAMNLYTDQVGNLVKGTITHSLKLVLNGVSPQIRPLTPDPRCRGPITPTAFSCFPPLGARRRALRIQWGGKIFTCCVFCLSARLS